MPTRVELIKAHIRSLGGVARDSGVFSNGDKYTLYTMRSVVLIVREYKNDLAVFAQMAPFSVKMDDLLRSLTELANDAVDRIAAQRQPG